MMKDDPELKAMADALKCPHCGSVGFDLASSTFDYTHEGVVYKCEQATGKCRICPAQGPLAAQYPEELLAKLNPVKAP